MPPKPTPTFITEIPLVASDTEEKLLLARLESGRQLYNACLGEAMRRVKLIRQSKAYQFAAGLPRTANNKPNKARSEAFKKAWNVYDFSDYSIQGYAIGIRQSWIREHIDADTAQKLGTRAFRAARNVLLGRAKGVRFKGRNQMDSLEGKSKRSPMKWQKAENAGGYVNEFPTKTTKLSQRCVCGYIKKKPLSQRVHTCECGVVAQRDLLSANLARYVDVDGCYQAEAALDGFPSVDSLLWSAWQQAGNQYRQSSIGNPRIVNVVAAMASEKNDLEAS